MNSTVRQFITAYLSLFGFIFHFQLQWSKNAGCYKDIFLRFSLSFILSGIALYLILILFQSILYLRWKRSCYQQSLRMIYPFSLFHLEWFQFVNDEQWVLMPLLVYGSFCICFSVTLIHTLVDKQNNVPLQKSSFFTEINVLFASSFSSIFNTIKQLLTNPVILLGIPFYPVTWLLLSLQVIIFIKFAAFSFNNSFLFPISLVSSLLMPVLISAAVRNIFNKITPLGTLLITIICLFYFVLSFYYVTEGIPFDYSVFRLNADLLDHAESYALMFDRLQPVSYIFTFFFFLLSVFIVSRTKRRTASYILPQSFFRGVFYFSGYLFLFMVPLKNIDPIRNGYYSMKNFRLQEDAIAGAAQTLKEMYPFAVSPDSAIRPIENLPDIFLICLESCNGQLIESTTEAGHEITPFFNRLIPEGVYVEHFYGNSIQTIRGFFSILCGTLPSHREKISDRYPDLNVRALPGILSGYGYESYFIKAYHDLSFDNTGEFMKHTGFDHVYSITDDQLTEREKKMCWGWGLQDDIFYRKCFSIIDDEFFSRCNGTIRPPLFLTSFNVSNHMMFQDIPHDRKTLYPDAGKNDFKKNFRNSMFLADSCLREYFIQLEKRGLDTNALIIITGDHSFPRGDHSIRSEVKNEVGAWEENFRTPLLIIWKGHLQPKRITGYACSQIDILPTIFELLTLSPGHHSTGRSILRSENRKPVLVAQPYDGTHMVSIEYPYKLVKNVKGRTLRLFNLAEDPFEQNDLSTRKSLKPVMIKLQDALTGHLINQVLIQENRLYPAPDSTLVMRK